MTASAKKWWSCRPGMLEPSFTIEDVPSESDMLFLKHSVIGNRFSWIGKQVDQELVELS